jgi:hypothetical protein
MTAASRFLGNEKRDGCCYSTAGRTSVAASTVTLRVVGGDEKGSLKSDIVKYGHES